MKGTLLITKRLRFKTIKISAAVICKILFCLSFVIAFLFFVSTYTMHLSYEENLRFDIEVLKIKLNNINNGLHQTQEVYNELFTKNFERKNAYDIISSVNPNINKRDISEWVDVIFYNSNMLGQYLNSHSIEKIKGINGINSISVGASLILAIGAMESDYYLQRRSNKNAAGGMQIMTGLAKDLGIRNRFDPKENIKGGIKHLITLLKRFEKYPDQLELTLASYNAGYYRVTSEWIANWGTKWKDINSGLYLDDGSFNETRKYVITISNLTRLFTNGNWAEKEDEFWYKYKWEIPKIVD